MERQADRLARFGLVRIVRIFGVADGGHPNDIAGFKELLLAAERLLRPAQLCVINEPAVLAETDVHTLVRNPGDDALNPFAVRQHIRGEMRFLDAPFQVRRRDLFHRPMPTLAAGKAFQPGTQRLISRHLRRRIHSRPHGKTHLIDGILAVHGQLDAEPFGVFLAEQINKLTPHLFQIPCPLTAHAVRHLLEHQRLLERGVVLGFRDPVQLTQAAQHVMLAADGGVRVTVGVVLGGGLGQARNDGALGEREILGVFPEVRPRGGLNAVRVGPKEGLVQIDCQDFIFGKVMLQTVREDGFLDLALVAAFRRQEQALDHLLRDGAAALALCAGLEVDEKGI